MAQLSPSNDSGITALQKRNSKPIKTGAPATQTNFQMTDGWYMVIACTTGVVTANTRVGPLVFGVLTLALIYQLTLLIQHK